MTETPIDEPKQLTIANVYQLREMFRRSKQLNLQIMRLMRDLKIPFKT